MKEEERKWAGEDNKADDVDVTLRLYQPSIRYMYFSIKRAEPTSTWYLIPQQNIPHLPKWGVRSSGNDIIINHIVNTWAPPGLEDSIFNWIHVLTPNCTHILLGCFFCVHTW